MFVLPRQTLSLIKWCYLWDDSLHPVIVCTRRHNVASWQEKTEENNIRFILSTRSPFCHFKGLDSIERFHKSPFSSSSSPSHSERESESETHRKGKTFTNYLLRFINNKKRKQALRQGEGKERHEERKATHKSFTIHQKRQKIWCVGLWVSWKPTSVSHLSQHHITKKLSGK